MRLFSSQTNKLKQDWKTFVPYKMILFIFFAVVLLLQSGIGIWNYFASNKVPNVLGPLIVMIVVILGVIYLARLVLGFVPLDKPKDFIIFAFVIVAVVMAFVYLERYAPFIFSLTPLNSVTSFFR